MTAVTVYVPRDAAALSIGAGEVAAAIAKESSARGVELKLIRNGSRGACWLEPLVEVVTANGRVAYGPVTVADIPSLFASDFLNGGAHPLFLGPTQRFVVQGHEGTSLFLVGEGSVEVRLRREDGTDWLVETMGRGEVVGEMALLTRERRAATVRSVEETLVYEISRQLYQPLLEAHPEWLEELATVMEERLVRRRSRIEAGADQAPTAPLLDRIRRNFFS